MAKFLTQSNPLSKWIRQAMSEVVDGDPCKAIACIHKEGSRDVEVYTVVFTADKVWDPDDMAGLFRNRAETHVAEIPGNQRFFLLAFYGDNPEPRARRPFHVMVGDSDSDGFGTSDPPTPMGQLQQLMRHAEQTYQFNIRHTQFLMTLQNTLLKQSEEKNARLMSDNAHVLDIARATILAQAGQEKERMLEEARREERKELFKLLPGLVNSVLGQEVFPQDSTDSKLLETLLGHLDEQKIQLLAGVLPPEVMGLVTARASKMLEERNRARSLAEKAVVRENGKDDTDPLLVQDDPSEDGEEGTEFH